MNKEIELINYKLKSFDIKKNKEDKQDKKKISIKKNQKFKNFLKISGIHLKN
jgi:hypothetical protein